ncbi:MAG: hypothetical protein PUF12_04445 [Thermoflexaceae bacterium]|nr:hypothetical protein [Thermoflexaceae bacterium]
MQKKEKSLIYQEVLGYLELGVDISLNGKSIETCDKGIYSLKENTCYMREYIRNSEGDLKKINFTTIKKR